MGCSGSRTLDIYGNPVVIHKKNPQREENILRYNDITKKIEMLKDSNPEVLEGFPKDKEYYNQYYSTHLEKLTAYNLKEEEFYDGALWNFLKSDFSIDCVSYYDTIVNLFKDSYVNDSLDLKKIKVSKFKSKLKEISIFKSKAVIINGGKTVEVFEKILEFIKYDKNVSQIEGLCIGMNYEQMRNDKLIEHISEMIQYTPMLNHLAIILEPLKLDEKHLHTEIAADQLSPIFKSVTLNIRIKIFAILAPQKITLTLDDKNQKLLCDIVRNNEFLRGLVLSKFKLSPKYFELLMKYISKHKLIEAFGIDIYGTWSEDYYKQFYDVFKKNKNLKICCYYNGESLYQIYDKQKQSDEIFERCMNVSLPLGHDD
jgi:hypothetical protein